MTKKNIKNGKEVLDDFFTELATYPEMDADIAKELVDLYNNDKLTDTNISNKLLEIRKKNAKN